MNVNAAREVEEFVLLPRDYYDSIATTYTRNNTEPTHQQQRGAGVKQHEFIRFINGCGDLHERIPRTALYKLTAWSRVPSMTGIAKLPHYQTYVDVLTRHRIPLHYVNNTTLKRALQHAT